MGNIYVTDCSPMFRHGLKDRRRLFSLRRLLFASYPLSFLGRNLNLQIIPNRLLCYISKQMIHITFFIKSKTFFNEIGARKYCLNGLNEWRPLNYKIRKLRFTLHIVFASHKDFLKYAFNHFRIQKIRKPVLEFSKKEPINTLQIFEKSIINNKI